MAAAFFVLRPLKTNRHRHLAANQPEAYQQFSLGMSNTPTQWTLSETSIYCAFVSGRLRPEL
jgi:hypothetical protein